MPRKPKYCHRLKMKSDAPFLVLWLLIMINVAVSRFLLGYLAGANTFDVGTY